MKQSFYTTAIKYCYYILFFVTPFVVFPFNSELFEFNKMLFIYGISVFILGFWILRAMQEGKLFVQSTPLDIPIGIYLFSQIISTAFSMDQHTSLFGYYGRFNGGLLSTITYIFLFYAFISNIRSQGEETIRTIFKISALASILIVLWGLPGTFNHDLSCLLFTSKFDNSCWTAQFRPAERMFSLLGQPNWLGAYLAITIFGSFYIFITSKHSKSELFLSTMSILFSYIGLLLSRSRSALGSLVPGALLFIGIYVWMVFKKKTVFEEHKKLLFSICGGLVILTFLIRTGVPKIDSILSFSFLRKDISQSAPLQNNIQTQEKSPSDGGITDSLDIRKIVWEGALRLGIEYPLFGTGVETFGYAYYSVRPISHNLTSEWDYLYNKAHNEYLNLFATTGWFGLLSFIALYGVFLVNVFILLIKSIRSDESNNTSILMITILSIFSSICITNFLGFSITVINLYWYLLLIIGTLFLIPAQKEIALKHKSPSLMQTGLVLFLSVWLLNSLVSYWFADYKYAQSEMALRNNNSAAAVNLLQEAIALRGEHVYQDKLSYALAQYASVLAYQKKNEEMKQIIDLAEKLNLQSIQDSPQNVLYWKTRVKNQFLFYQANLDKKYLFTGLSALDELYKLAPTDPKIPYFSATYYSLLTDDEKNPTQKLFYQQKSLEAIEKTISLKKNYADAYYLKVQLLKKYGKKEEARAALKYYINEYAPNNPGLVKEMEQI